MTSTCVYIIVFSRMSLFEWLFLACNMQSGSMADECEFMSFEGKSNKPGLENNAVIDYIRVCISYWAAFESHSMSLKFTAFLTFHELPFAITKVNSNY